MYDETCSYHIVPVKGASAASKGSFTKLSLDVSSSGRKTGGMFRMTPVDGKAAESKTVWVVSFDSLDDFRAELEGMSAANGLDVGPEIIDCQFDQPIEGAKGRYHLVESYAGLSLSSMIGSPISGPFCCDDLEQRAARVSKLAFDLACDIKAMHEASRYYLDLKPANVAVKELEDGGIRATLVDFESMSSASALPAAIQTRSIYKKAEEVFGGMPDNRVFDLACLTLVLAAALQCRPVDELCVDDIERLHNLVPGSDFVSVQYGILSVNGIDDGRLGMLASACGLCRKAGPEDVENSTIYRHRRGYLDSVDLEKIGRLPTYMISSKKEDLAVAFHRIWWDEEAKGIPTPEEVRKDFFSQDEPLKRQGIAQVLSVLEQLEQLCYRLVPVDILGPSVAVEEEFPPGVVVLLARKEHDRWVKLHRSQGYEYAERVDGKRLPMKNEFLLDWKDLVKRDEAGREIAVDEKDPESLMLTRAKNDIKWAGDLIGVMREYAGLCVIKNQMIGTR